MTAVKTITTTLAWSSRSTARSTSSVALMRSASGRRSTPPAVATCSSALSARTSFNGRWTSIFGVTLGWLQEKGIEPGSGFQDVARWTSEHWPGLEYRERDFCTNFRCIEGDGRGAEDDRWEYDLPDAETRHDSPACGYWIAHVVSPRGLLQHGPYRGMPVQHAVVMRGGDLVWDPHPQRDMGVGQMVGMAWWIARDPVLLHPKWVARELTGLGEEERDAA